MGKQFSLSPQETAAGGRRVIKSYLPAVMYQPASCFATWSQWTWRLAVIGSASESGALQRKKTSGWYHKKESSPEMGTKSILTKAKREHSQHKRPHRHTSCEKLFAQAGNKRPGSTNIHLTPGSRAQTWQSSNLEGAEGSWDCTIKYWAHHHHRHLPAALTQTNPPTAQISPHHHSPV